MPTKNLAAVTLGRRGGKARTKAKAAAAKANGAKGGRPSLASERLVRLKAADPDHRAQAYDSWLEVASASHVRKHWRSWMGPKPGWAFA